MRGKVLPRIALHLEKLQALPPEQFECQIIDFRYRFLQHRICSHLRGMFQHDANQSFANRRVAFRRARECDAKSSGEIVVVPSFRRCFGFDFLDGGFAKGWDVVFRAHGVHNRMRGQEALEMLSVGFTQNMHCGTFGSWCNVCTIVLSFSGVITDGSSFTFFFFFFLSFFEKPQPQRSSSSHRSAPVALVL